MKCYRFNCVDNCDDLKKLYCLRRLTKEQYKLIKEVNKDTSLCHICGNKMIRARYYVKKDRYFKISLCTNCKLKDRINGKTA